MLFLSNNQTVVRDLFGLGAKNQVLMHRALDLGYYEDVKQLQKFDYILLSLLRKTVSLDFIGQITQGHTLLVGEGNLSFAVSLAKHPQIFPTRLIATTFEANDKLLPKTIENAQTLKAKGVTVLHGVDATDLSNTFGSWLFDTIIFQFPHVGSREPVDGRNPNFILMRDFLSSAFYQLSHNGKVLVSAANTSHYRGAFQFEEAAEWAGFQSPEVYPFDPTQFPEYEHTMTHQCGSALENHDTLSTWVFRI